MPAAAGAASVLVPPPGGGVYQSAYPDFGADEDAVRSGRIRSFERLAGKPLAWTYFSNNWFDGRIRFPAEAVRTIRAAGSTPFIRIMPRSDWSSLAPDERFSMQSIIDGRWDDPDGNPATPDGLDGWCEAAAASGGPLLAEFGAEVNNKVHAWSGRWNGAGTLDGYGDPTVPDGPERYRDAFRHVVDDCRARGATSITWFIHFELGGWPAQRWNSDYANYYPGDDYVDWIGFSDYGAVSAGSRWHSFGGALDREYGELASLADKPMAVLEWGVREDPERARRKARWITEAAADVASGRWPRVRAMSFWSERWRNSDGSRTDLRIDSSRQAARAYRRAMAAPAFVGEASFAER